MSIVDSFQIFSDNFSKRLQRYSAKDITEDCLRYDLFAALLESGYSADSCVLELSHPHPSFKGREIDLVTYRNDSRPESVVEMKYFKEIPSQKQDTTQYMAKLVVDLIKLKFTSELGGNLYFVMATDYVMKRYISNKSNSFSKLFDEPLNTVFSISPSDKSSKNSHFNKNIAKDINLELFPLSSAIKIERIFEDQLVNGNAIYIFQVHG
ncbi:hypothetical protein LA59_10515 [Vibrio harveyi]|uniref:hypothetical protein n=1 Tax=Vibrio TaxID=662 RepID=UPI000539560F|nr:MULTISPECIES: hypothetical protein [Vibrio]AIV05881.1 hypothetical protein LA59_10515 [Vibrio harveyi]EIV8497602.1 hypothetical protein [Vibrio vulnificus]ELV8675421.1 hypothetical protein [Vibrio vulnificus]MCA3945314.1 hypothetical protein [Vibrio vulnificus]HDM8156844.1 hypothetical protein [Vibrio harveyi]